MGFRLGLWGVKVEVKVKVGIEDTQLEAMGIWKVILLKRFCRTFEESGTSTSTLTVLSSWLLVAILDKIKSLTALG
jgi:hypothetical protein